MSAPIDVRTYPAGVPCWIDSDVGVGAVNGAVSVLLVEGIWWQLVAPQRALCSVVAAGDPKTAEAILREVFGSGLTPA